MANLVRLRNIHLYIGWTENATDCYEAKKLLDLSGIKYNFLHYHDEGQKTLALEPLSTWHFGKEPNRYNKTLTKFPVLHYDALYDDWTSSLELADGLEEIKKFVELAKTLPVT